MEEDDLLGEDLAGNGQEPPNPDQTEGRMVACMGKHRIMFLVLAAQRQFRVGVSGDYPITCTRMHN